MTAALDVRELRKSYGAVAAVEGVSFAVEYGEVFGLLGPNGAGKTTTVEILEGYRPRDGGDVTVLGVDPDRGGSAWRERIGVVLQASELPAALTVREVHRMFAGYYAKPRDIDEVIGLVGLEEKSDARVKTLSGGQKRRLDLGVALVGDPELVFLDEPTTGFDPAARRTAWELVRSLRALGKTIVLTTHYLDEAQQLADRVAVLREGKIVKIGSPAELIGGTPRVVIRYREGGRDVVIETDEPTRVLAELTGAAAAAGKELEALEVVRPSLEDVYLDLDRRRGRGMEAVPARGAHAAAAVLAESRIRRLRVHLPSDAVPPPGSGVRRGTDRRVPGRPDALLTGMLGYGCANTAVRGSRDHARDPPRGRDASSALRATPLPPSTYLAAILTSTFARLRSPDARE